MKKYFKITEFKHRDITTIGHYKRECDPNKEVEMIPDTELTSIDGNSGIISLYGFTLVGNEDKIDEIINYIKQKTGDN